MMMMMMMMMKAFSSRIFEQLFPACAFFFHKWRSSHAHQFHSYTRNGPQWFMDDRSLESLPTWNCVELAQLDMSSQWMLSKPL